METTLIKNVAPEQAEIIKIETSEDAEMYADVILAMEDLVSVDTETAGREEALSFRKAALQPPSSTIRLVQFASDRDPRCFVFDVWKVGLEDVRRIIEGRVLYAHNATFEYMFFLFNGINPMGIFCTMLMRRVLSEPGISLADTVKDILGIDMDKSMQASGWHAKTLTDAQWLYAGLDAFYGARIVEPLIQQMQKLAGGIEAFKFYNSAVPVIAKIQMLGVPFDTETHEAQAAIWQKEAEQAKSKAEALMGGINAASPKEVGAWLEENISKKVLDKWPRTEKTQQLQISAEAMDAASGEHEAIAEYSKWKLLQKLDSTYGRGILKDVNPISKMLHPSYMIIGAKTGRYSSNSPNFQNWPREGGMREMVVAPEGYTFIDADYGAMELRIMAVYANDRIMLDAFNNGHDLHRLTASVIAGIPVDQVTSEQRQAAKAVNFGLIYGTGPEGLQRSAKSSYNVDMTLDEAKQSKAIFLETYAGVAAWQRATTQAASESMRSTTAMGLTRNYIKEGKSNREVYTVSLNTPIQGTGSEILTEALIRTDKSFTSAGIDARIVAHVHDQIIVLAKNEDKHEAARLLERSMIEGAEVVLNGIPTNGLVEMVEGTVWSKKHMKPYAELSSTEDGCVTTAECVNKAVAMAFREYSSMGYSLATMEAGAKHPRGQTDWGNRPAEKLPAGHENLGIIHYWSKTACIDCDDLEKVRTVFEFAGLDLEALTAGDNVPAWHGNPHNRMKYLFKLPEGVEFRSDSLNVFGDVVFELRGTTVGEQLQDVIPPSVHPDGHKYHWVKPLVPLNELAVLPPELVTFWQEFASKKADYQSLLGDNTLLAERYRAGGGSSELSDRTRALIDNFNAAHKCTEFLAMGNYKAPQGWGKKWLYGGSSSGNPGVWVSDDDDVVVSHHTGDPLGFRKPHDAFDLFRLFVHNGEFESAKEAALEELGEPEIIEGELLQITEEEMSQQKPGGVDGGEPDDPFSGMADGLTGFLRRIYDFNMASAYRPVNSFAIAGAFSVLSTLTENHYLIDGYGTRLNVYLILIGPTGFGKESPRNSAKKLLGKLGMGNLLIESAASGVGLKQKLSNNRTLLMMPDEIGTMLSMASGRNPDQHQKGLQRELRTLFSSAGTIYAGHPRADSRRDIPNIENPFVNMLGTSTPIEFMSGIQADQLENGLVNRLLMIDAPKTPAERNRNAMQDPPDDLIKDLTEFTMRRINYPTRVLISEAGQKLILESEQAQDKLVLSDAKMAMLYGRVNEITMRLAGLMAISDRPEKPVINAQHMRWAMDFVGIAFKLMERKFADNYYENETEKEMKHILSIIRNQKEEWVGRAIITKKAKMRAKHIEEHIRTLKQAEMIEESEVETKGRKARMYRLVGGF